MTVERETQAEVLIHVGDVIDTTSHAITEHRKKPPQLRLKVKSRNGRHFIMIYADTKYEQFRRVRITKILSAKQTVMPNRNVYVKFMSIEVELEDAGDEEPKFYSDITNKQPTGETTLPEFTYGAKKDGE